MTLGLIALSMLTLMTGISPALAHAANSEGCPSFAGKYNVQVLESSAACAIYEKYVVTQNGCDSVRIEYGSSNFIEGTGADLAYGGSSFDGASDGESLAFLPMNTRQYEPDPATRGTPFYPEVIFEFPAHWEQLENPDGSKRTVSLITGFYTRKKKFWAYIGGRIQDHLTEVDVSQAAQGRLYIHILDQYQATSGTLTQSTVRCDARILLMKE